MPWCPDCHYEYQPHVAACPDCGSALVNTPPEEPAGSPDIELQELPPIPGRHYASMLTEVLEKENIPFLVKDTFMSTALRAESGIGNAVKVQVPEDCYARALNIFHDLFPDTESG